MLLLLLVKGELTARLIIRNHESQSDNCIVLCGVLRITVSEISSIDFLQLFPPEETPAAVAGGEARKNSTEELEAELEMDLDNLKLDDIDTTDVNLDDEDLLED